MNAPHTIPNPEGWDKPWPFADEVELWRIPADEREAAFRHERRREWMQINEPEQWNRDLEESALTCGPWLSLDERSKEFYKTQPILGRLPAARIIDAAEAERIFSDLEGPAIFKGPTIVKGPVDDGCRAVMGDELIKETHDCGGWTVAIKLDVEQGREEIRNQLKALINGLHLPSGSGSPKDREKNLRSLAIYRARRLHKGPDFMHMFRGTSYKRRTMRDAKNQLAEAEKLLVL